MMGQGFLAMVYLNLEIGKIRLWPSPLLDGNSLDENESRLVYKLKHKHHIYLTHPRETCHMYTRERPTHKRNKINQTL